MAGTPVYGFRYPAVGDAPHVPTDIQNLAEDVEGRIQAVNLMTTLLTMFSASGSVTTQQTTSSASFADLTTVGPSVSVTSTGTLAVVLFSANMWNGSAGTTVQCSVAVSGATTVAASAVSALSGMDTGTGASLGYGAAQFVIVPINPGSNTYTMKYLTAAGTGTFRNRRIWVFAP